LSAGAYASAASEPPEDASAALDGRAGAAIRAGALATAAGGGVRPAGVLLKALAELSSLPVPPLSAIRAGEEWVSVLPELLPARVSWARTVEGPTVLITDAASWSIVLVAEASVCASPSIVGASAVVTGVSAVVAGAGARPAGGALFVAERSVGATAFLTVRL